jgi:hypothetical protein
VNPIASVRFVFAGGAKPGSRLQYCDHTSQPGTSAASSPPWIHALKSNENAPLQSPLGGCVPPLFCTGVRRVGGRTHR